MGRHWSRIILLIALVLAVNGSSPQRSAQASPAKDDVVIQFGCNASGCTYNPSEVLIEPGEKVEWEGDFSMHPLVSDDGLWTTVNAGTQFSYTFTMTGTYLFHCAIHGAPGGVGMSGRVIVKELPYKVYLSLLVR